MDNITDFLPLNRNYYIASLIPEKYRFLDEKPAVNTRESHVSRTCKS